MYRIAKAELEGKVKELTIQLEEKNALISSSASKEGVFQESAHEIQLLNERLELEIKERANLEMEIKAYEEAVAQLRKQNIQQ